MKLKIKSGVRQFLLGIFLMLLFAGFYKLPVYATTDNGGIGPHQIMLTNEDDGLFSGTFIFQAPSDADDCTAYFLHFSDYIPYKDNIEDPDYIDKAVMCSTDNEDILVSVVDKNGYSGKLSSYKFDSGNISMGRPVMLSSGESITLSIQYTKPTVYLYIQNITMVNEFYIDANPYSGNSSTVIYAGVSSPNSLPKENSIIRWENPVKEDGLYRISAINHSDSKPKFFVNGTEYTKDAVVSLKKGDNAVIYPSSNGIISETYITKGVPIPLNLKCGINCMLEIPDSLNTEEGIYSFEAPTDGNWIIESGSDTVYVSLNKADLTDVTDDNATNHFKFSANAGEKIYVRVRENEVNDDNWVQQISIKTCPPSEVTICRGEAFPYGADWEIVGDITTSGEYDCKYVGTKPDENVASGKIKINVRNHETVANIVKATPYADGKIEYICKHCNKLVETKVISRPQAISLKSDSVVYTGKALKPSVTVKDVCGNTIAKSNYTVKYSNNKEIGKASIKVSFTGASYFGELTKTFSIVPKTTSIKKVKAGSKKLTVSIKKLSKSNATGIEVQVSTDKKFKKSVKKASTKKLSQTEVTIKSLKAGKKYYVRIRTYKTVKGKKYYSDWKTYSKTVKVLK